MSEENKTAAEFGAEGGKKRAQALTKDQRRDIARQAAEARWAAEGKLKVLRATHEAHVDIAGFMLPCAVLEDGTRVLSRFGFMQGIGRTGKAKGGRRYDEESKIPVFLTADNLKPFITNELLENSAPVPFRPLGGGGIAMGYRAELLTQVCNVFINAKFAGVLKANQEHIAERCKLLSQGFATVGIAALIDEATGYQDVRAHDALARILEAFVAKEIQPWVSTFPPEFYKEMFRLRGIPFTGTLKRPKYIGHLTNNLVYKRLAPGVLVELRQKNPVTESGRRKTTHHRWLTPAVGHPKLLHHLGKVTALMAISKDWKEFEAMLNKHMPPYKHYPLLDGTVETAS
jgi:hypothetical protein